jgi:hypothetical protein
MTRERNNPILWEHALDIWWPVIYNSKYKSEYNMLAHAWTVTIFLLDVRTAASVFMDKE